MQIKLKKFRVKISPQGEHPLTHPRQFHQNYPQLLFSHHHHSIIKLGSTSEMKS